MNNDIRKILYKNSYILRKNKVKIKNVLNKNEMIGGNKKLCIDYDNNKFIFEESKIDKNHFILSSSDHQDCVIVIISVEDQIAEIHSIGNYKSCFYTTNQNVGSILLKITLKMLKKFKDKLGINLIVLTDNSLKKCGNNEIKLAIMLILLTGDTWYGKYGFRPIKIENNKYIMDHEMIKQYEKNKKIINKIKISDIDLIKYVKKSENKKLIKAVNKLININPDYLLKNFLFNLLNDYENNCLLFYKFYESLYNKISLFDPVHKMYGLFI